MIYPYDYYYLWAAGRVVLQGNNVYEPQVLRQTMLEIGWPPELMVWGFTHPPWTLWLYLPFSVFPFRLASILWVFSQVVLSVFIARSVVRIFNLYLKDVRTVSFAQIALALFLFPPVIKVLAYGQSSVVLLFGLTLFIEKFLKGKMRAAGLFLSLTLLKPHHLIPFFLVLGVRELRAKRYELILWATFGLVLQIAIGLLLYPQGYKLFFEYAPKLYHSSGVLPGSALAQLLEANFSFTLARPLLFIAACLLGLFYELRYRPNFLQFVFVMLPLSMLATPYAFLHAYVLLAFPFLVLTQDFFQRFGERAYMILLAAFAFSGIAVITFIRFEYLVVLLPLFVLIFAVRRTIRQPSL